MPEPVIRRRFWKSLVNFDRLYQPLATTRRLYDGGAAGGRPLIAHGAGGRAPVVLDAAKWQDRKNHSESVDLPVYEDGNETGEA